MINSKIVCVQERECKNTESCNIISEIDGDCKLGLQIPTGGLFLNIFWHFSYVVIAKVCKEVHVSNHPDFAEQ